MAIRPCKECGKDVSTEAKSCPHCGAKAPAKSAGVIGIVFVAVVGLGVYQCSSKSDMAQPISAKATAPAQAQAKPVAVVKPDDTFKTACLDTVAARRTNYAALMQKNEYWNAALELHDCANLLNDAELKTMVRDAEIKSHLADINSRDSTAHVKAYAMEKLINDYPDIGAKYQAQLTKYKAIEEKQAATQAKQYAAQQAKKKKSEGVYVGMTQDDVRASSWGKPRSINTTIRASGTQEQWVYGIGSYLYFENGILTTIQN